MKSVARLLMISAIAVGAAAVSPASLKAQDLAVSPSNASPWVRADSPPSHYVQIVAPQQGRLAQQCIPYGQTCVLNGTPCCAGSCQGNFPNTYCQ
jgi:hypothetical protein